MTENNKLEKIVCSQLLDRLNYLYREKDIAIKKYLNSIKDSSNTYNEVPKYLGILNKVPIKSYNDKVNDQKYYITEINDEIDKTLSALKSGCNNRM